MITTFIYQWRLDISYKSIFVQTILYVNKPMCKIPTTSRAILFILMLL